MATTDETLVSAVEADAACRTHLGDPPDTRFYPDSLPQKPTLPAATYQRIAGAPVNSVDGLDGLDNGVYQIDVYAQTALAAREAADAIRDAIDESTSLGAVFLAFRTGFEQEADPRLYRRSFDVSLWHAES